MIKGTNFLVEIYSNISIANGKQRIDLITDEDKQELKEKTKQNFHNQILFTTPEIEVENYLIDLKKWVKKDSLGKRKFNLKICPL